MSKFIFDANKKFLLWNSKNEACIHMELKKTEIIFIRNNYPSSISVVRDSLTSTSHYGSKQKLPVEIIGI